MRTNKFFLNLSIGVILAMLLMACNKKYQGTNNIESVKYNRNETTYTPKELDSVKARNYIIKLRLQEVYDLATNYAAGNKDTEIDRTLYRQIKEYFEKPDSTAIQPLIKELDSLKARFVKISNVTSKKEVIAPDTLDFAAYQMAYYDKDKRYIGTQHKEVQYILKETPIGEKKFKSEFKFFFVNFYPNLSENDSISVGNTKKSKETSTAEASDIDSLGAK